MKPLFNLEEDGNYRVIEAMSLLVEELDEELDMLEMMYDSDIISGRLYEVQSIIDLIKSKYIEGFK